MFKQLLVTFLVLLPFVCPQGKIYKAVNLATEKCLDSSGGGALYTVTCGGNFQSWQRVGLMVQDVATGFCLESTARGCAYTLPCNGRSNQQWELKTDGKTNSYILTNLATGFVLDSDIDGSVYTSIAHGGGSYKWQVEEIKIAQ